jgi:hypothetical protein
VDEGTGMTWDERCTEFTAGLALPDAAAADRLTVWLEGIGLELPPDEPAYPVLFRLAVYAESTERLSALTAVLLEQWLAGNWSAAIDFSSAAYNLLHLAAELRDPARLAGPICQLYRTRTVKGMWLGASLPSVLLEAMIVNQRGQEPEALNLWKRMLLGRHDEYVGGSVEHGFMGIVNRHPLDLSALEFAVTRLLRQGTEIANESAGYLCEVHPGIELAPLFKRAQARARSEFQEELTRERNRKAAVLLQRGVSPRNKDRWNMQWAITHRKAGERFQSEPPARPADRDRMKEEFIDRQFAEGALV